MQLFCILSILWCPQYNVEFVDSTGKCVCYVGADLSMKGVHNYVTNYVILITVIAAVFLAGCILLGMRIYIGARRADQMESLIERQKRDKELTREIIEAFAKVVDLKDAYTQGHSFRVAKYTDMLARELNCDEETIEKYLAPVAALLIAANLLTVIMCIVSEGTFLQPFLII